MMSGIMDPGEIPRRCEPNCTHYFLIIGVSVLKIRNHTSLKLRPTTALLMIYLALRIAYMCMGESE